MKFLAPDAYSTLIQFTAHATVSTIVTPGVWWPVSSAPAPTSLVPIHSVYIVSSGFNFNEPFVFSVK